MKKADLPKTSDPVNLVKPLLPRNLFSHCLLFNRITQPNCSKYTHACLTKLYESFCFSLFEVSRPRRGKIFFERRGKRFSLFNSSSSIVLSSSRIFFHFRNNRNCDIFLVLSEKNSSKYCNGAFHRIIGFESKEVRFSESGTYAAQLDTRPDQLEPDRGLAEGDRCPRRSVSLPRSSN